MVALGMPPAVQRAASLSATIEHAGQCTALRVLLAPEAEATPEKVRSHHSHLTRSVRTIHT